MVVLVQDLDGNPPDAEDAAEFRDALALDFPVLVDPDGAWTTEWNPTGVYPQGTVVDREGVIRWREVGGSDEAEQRAKDAVIDALAAG